MPSSIQSNVVAGAILMAAAEDLTGKTARICAIGASGVSLNASATVVQPYVLEDDGASGATVAIRPLNPNSQIRIVLKGTCAVGDTLVVADPGTAADKGKVRVKPTAAGTYAIVGIAEEVGADGQAVLVRPFLTGLTTTVAG